MSSARPPLSQVQIDAVLKLAGPARYEHFVKQVADWEEAWGLYSGGWALSGTSDGRRVFPLWPAREYAAACRTDEWANYEPTAIPLADLIDELLPSLERDGVLPGVFYTTSDKGVTPSAHQLLDDLKAAASEYGDNG